MSRSLRLARALSASRTIGLSSKRAHFLACSAPVRDRLPVTAPPLSLARHFSAAAEPEGQVEHLQTRTLYYLSSVFQVVPLSMSSRRRQGCCWISWPSLSTLRRKSSSENSFPTHLMLSRNLDFSNCQVSDS